MRTRKASFTHGPLYSGEVGREFRCYNHLKTFKDCGWYLKTDISWIMKYTWAVSLRNTKCEGYSVNAHYCWILESFEYMLRFHKKCTLPGSVIQIENSGRSNFIKNICLKLLTWVLIISEHLINSVIFTEIFTCLFIYPSALWV